MKALMLSSTKSMWLYTVWLEWLTRILICNHINGNRLEICDYDIGPEMNKSKKACSKLEYTHFPNAFSVIFHTSFNTMICLLLI